jgi:beta-phosphoglucomutase-like phosphatase (HAD superfamily)
MTDTYGLIFDVNGVITDTEAVNRVVSIRVFADLFGIRGVQAEDFEAGLGRGAEEYIKAAAAVRETNLSPAQVAEATRLRQRYFLQSLRENPIPPFPGMLKLVRAALEDKAFRTAIAYTVIPSNSTGKTAIPWTALLWQPQRNQTCPLSRPIKL